jgi:uncharacterized protein (DUF2252 family)
MGSTLEGGASAFGYSATSFREYLLDAKGLAVAPENLLWLFDEELPSVQQLLRIKDHVSGRLTELGSQRGRDVSIFCYYVGHGAFPGRDRTYCLLVRSTEAPPLTEDTSLRLPTLAEVLKGVAPESRRIIILDCCFSAAAVRSFQSPLNQLTAVKVQESLSGSGVALLCASSADDVTEFTDDRTRFTSAMLDVLTAGEGTTEPFLSLQRVCDLTYAQLTDLYGSDVTRPECHAPNQSGGDVADLPLFPNPGVRQRAEATGAILQDDRAQPASPPDPFVVYAGLGPIVPVDVDSSAWVWSPQPSRDAVDLLTSGLHASLRSAELVPVRLGRMMLSPTTYLRGAFAVMAQDLALMPWSGITTRLCGETALSNVAVTPTPDGRHVLDCSDYGETVVGPWDYDLLRLLVSVAVQARENRLPKVRKLLREVIAAYRSMTKAVATKPSLEQEFFPMDERLLEHLGVSEILSAYRRMAAPLPRREPNWTVLDPDTRLLRENESSQRRAEGQEMERLQDLTGRYRQRVSAERKTFLDRFRLVEAITIVVGVGSIRSRDYVLLFRRNDDGEDLLLRATEAVPAAYARCLAASAPSTVSDGARVVLGMRESQSMPDPLLEWVDHEQTSFVFRGYGRGRRPRVGPEADRQALRDLALSMAAFLAKVHTRHRDPTLLLAAMADGKAFGRNLTTFAISYADQVEADHRNLVAEFSSRRSG